MDIAEDGVVYEHRKYTPYVCSGNSVTGETRIWLQVINIDQAGTTITGNTVDNNQVQVKLHAPLTEPVSGWIEAMGKLQGRTMLCSEFVVFPEEMCKSVDTEGHRALAKLLSNLDDPWNLGESSSSNENANGYGY